MGGSFSSSQIPKGNRAINDAKRFRTACAPSNEDVLAIETAVSFSALSKKMGPIIEQNRWNSYFQENGETRICSITIPQDVIAKMKIGTFKCDINEIGDTGTKVLLNAWPNSETSTRDTNIYACAFETATKGEAKTLKEIYTNFEVKVNRNEKKISLTVDKEINPKTVKGIGPEDSEKYSIEIIGEWTTCSCRGRGSPRKAKARRRHPPTRRAGRSGGSTTRDWARKNGHSDRHTRTPLTPSCTCKTCCPAVRWKVTSTAKGKDPFFTDRITVQSERTICSFGFIDGEGNCV